MLVFISKGFNNEQKEKIVNAYYEISPTVPIFIDYQKPITRIINPNISTDSLRMQKCIGDDILDIKDNDEKRNKVTSALSNYLGEEFLVDMLLSRTIIKSTQNKVPTVKIIDNITNEKEIKSIIKKKKEEQAVILTIKEAEKYQGVQNVVIRNFEFDNLVKTLKETCNSTPKEEKDLEQLIEESRKEEEAFIEETNRMRRIVCKDKTETQISEEIQQEQINEIVNQQEPVIAEEERIQQQVNGIINEMQQQEVRNMRWIQYPWFENAA